MLLAVIFYSAHFKDNVNLFRQSAADQLEAYTAKLGEDNAQWNTAQTSRWYDLKHAFV